MTDREWKERLAFAGFKARGRQVLGLTVREVEVRRHDTDDGEGASAKRDGSAQNSGIPSEPPLPHAVADHDLVMARRVSFRLEHPAKRRPDAEQLEHLQGRPGHGQALRPVAPHERVGPAGIRDHSFEDGVLLAPVEEVRGSDGEAAMLRDDFQHPHQAVRLGKRQRTQQDAVDDGEDRRRRSEPERECQHRHRREPAVLPQLADGIARVGQDVGKHAQGSSPPRRRALDPVGKALQARTHVPWIGLNEIALQHRPVADLLARVGVGGLFARAPRERVLVEVLELRGDLADQARVPFGCQPIDTPAASGRMRSSHAREPSLTGISVDVAFLEFGAVHATSVYAGWHAAAQYM